MLFVFSIQTFTLKEVISILYKVMNKKTYKYIIKEALRLTAFLLILQKMILLFPMLFMYLNFLELLQLMEEVKYVIYLKRSY